MNRLGRAFFRWSSACGKFIWILFFAALPGTAWAETGTPPGRLDLGITDSLNLGITGGGVGNAAVGDGGGEVSATGLRGAASYKDFFFSYERLDYSWSNIEKLPFGNGENDPWDTLHVMSLGYSRQGAITSNWKYFAGGAVTSSFEQEMQNSFGFGGFGGVTYIFSPTLQFTAGAGFVYHRVNTTVLPVIGVSWNRGIPHGFSVALGYPDTYLSYRFNPQWAVRSEIVQFDQDVFRLADDSTVEKEGFLKRQDLMADIGVEFTPVKNLSFILGARYYFDRELTIYDKDDDHEEKFDVDNGWGAVLNVKYRF